MEAEKAREGTASQTHDRLSSRGEGQHPQLLWAHYSLGVSRAFIPLVDEGAVQNNNNNGWWVMKKRVLDCEEGNVEEKLVVDEME